MQSYPKNSCNSHQIGSYTFDPSDLMGIGTYGKIYSAHRIIDNKKVALKTISKCNQSFNSHPNIILNQIKIHPRLKHPNIIQCFDVYVDSHQFYFALQFAEDGDLEQLMRARRLEEEEIIAILGEIVDGLVYLKEEGVVHRDIKPANVFKTQGRMKIADFGLAMIMDRQNIVREDMLIGSPYYMAPEVLKQGLYTHQCDVWALGVLLHEMVTGRTPYGDCMTIEELMGRADEPLLFDDIVSETIKSILCSMLEKNYELRITIEQLKQTLKNLSFSKRSTISSISTTFSYHENRSSLQSSLIADLNSSSINYQSCFNESLISTEINHSSLSFCISDLTPQQIRPLIYKFIQQRKQKEGSNNFKFASLLQKIDGGSKLNTIDWFYVKSKMRQRLGMLGKKGDIESQSEAIDLKRLIEEIENGNGEQMF